MSMNLNLSIAGQPVNLCQTPTTASYTILVEGNNLQTAKNYVQWMRDSFSAKQLQEMEQELKNDHQSLIACAWEIWEEGDDEPSLTLDEYLQHNHPVQQAQKIVPMVEEAMADNLMVEFFIM